MNQPSPYNPLVPRHVLIVEDESVQRVMLTKSLPDMGYTCETAASGEEALRRLAEKPYTIVMLDLNLPGIQGMDLFDKIRENWPQSSVIILTGYGDFDSAKQAIRMDVVDFLTKPCPLGEIERALDHAYRRYLITNAEPSKLLPRPAEPIPIDSPEDREDLNLQLIERDTIIEALKRAEGNRNLAAKKLGISVRTLYYRLSQYSITND